MYFAVAFVAILFGSEAIAGFLQSIPASIMSALTNIGRLLPAVGFALLLQPMMEAKNAIYFLLGFVLLVYLKLPVIAITLIGLAIAYIVVFERGKHSIKTPHSLRLPMWCTGWKLGDLSMSNAEILLLTKS